MRLNLIVAAEINQFSQVGTRVERLEDIPQ
jgi:hypothetical protein